MGTNSYHNTCGLLYGDKFRRQKVEIRCAEWFPSPSHLQEWKLPPGDGRYMWWQISWPVTMPSLPWAEMWGISKACTHTALLVNRLSVNFSNSGSLWHEWGNFGWVFFLAYINLQSFSGSQFFVSHHICLGTFERLLKNYLSNAFMHYPSWL